MQRTLGLPTPVQKRDLEFGRSASDLLRNAGRPSKRIVKMAEWRFSHFHYIRNKLVLERIIAMESKTNRL